MSFIPDSTRQGLIFYSNIDRLGHSVQVAIKEIHRTTTYQTLVMCGGPSPVAGTLNSITYVVYSDKVLATTNTCVGFALALLSKEIKISFHSWVLCTTSWRRSSVSGSS